jgi:hypothetical protein
MWLCFDPKREGTKNKGWHPRNIGAARKISGSRRFRGGSILSRLSAIRVFTSDASKRTAIRNLCPGCAFDFNGIGCCVSSSPRPTSAPFENPVIPAGHRCRKKAPSSRANPASDSHSFFLVSQSIGAKRETPSSTPPASLPGANRHHSLPGLRDAACRRGNANPVVATWLATEADLVPACAGPVAGGWTGTDAAIQKCGENGNTNDISHGIFTHLWHGSQLALKSRSHNSHSFRGSVLLSIHSRVIYSFLPM